MKYFFLTTVLFISLSGKSQDTAEFNFKGQLKSKLRNEGVAFASISIQNQQQGVVANERGEFEFLIPKKYWNDSVEIAAIGYKPYTALVKNLMQEPVHLIYLRDTVYELKEVVISNISASDILVKALENTEINSPDKPYEMECFYRNTIKESGTYVKLIECLYKAFDKGSNYPNIPNATNISYTAVRKSNNYTNPQSRIPYPFFRPQWVFTTHNYTRNRNYSLSENIRRSEYDVEFETPQYLNDKLLYVISATVKDSVKKLLYDMRLFIREKDYAIVRFEIDFKNRLYDIFPEGIPDKWRLRFKGIKATYVFEEYNGKMYIHYMNDLADYEWYDAKSGRLLTTGEENAQVMIQNIILPTNSKSTLKKVDNRTLPESDYAAEKAIWVNNEMVRQIPLDPKIKRDLEKEMSLEEQFLKNKQNQ